MQNNNRKKNNEAAQENSPVIQAASLEVIAGLLATLAEGISTFATALAIQEAQQLTINNTNNNVDIKGIQEQLNYLTKEVKKISKALNI
ncbi:MULTISPECIES: multidrug ABC transporter ATPase [unclassified Solibacillus]|uniref:multidrug ABC transporter ATPase n=1 Tax=unclassified Solibacillus TaxID=2637870 RepID=UPI0030F61C9A